MAQILGGPLQWKPHLGFSRKLLEFTVEHSDEGVDQLGIIGSPNDDVSVQKERRIRQRAASETRHVRVPDSALSEERDAYACGDHVNHFLRGKNVVQFPYAYAKGLGMVHELAIKLWMNTFLEHNPAILGKVGQ
jgi:hypothetical protein